jgi:hypothetical protein
VEKIKPFMSFFPNKDDFYEPDGINSITLKWVRRHNEKDKESIFHPHISLGI